MKEEGTEFSQKMGKRQKGGKEKRPLSVKDSGRGVVKM